MKIKLKRVYDPLSKEDGICFLVERLWPRGIKKVDLALDGWLKEIAPSTPLRKWFSHDPLKWDQFQKKYWAELDTNQELLENIFKNLRNKTITLLYSSKDTIHNSAASLKTYLEKNF